MRTIFLNGTVGVGKTSTAAALGEALAGRGIPHAVLDLDEIRRAWPAPSGDPFHEELTLANLGALAANYAGAGAQVLVIAGVIEADRDRYAAACGGGPFTLVRLRADHAVIARRLHRRHADRGERDWHLNRLPELDAILDGVRADIVLDTASATPDALARALLDRLFPLT